MSDHEDDRWLKDAMRMQAHVDDAGFADAVMARLPAPRRQGNARMIIVISAAVMVAGLFLGVEVLRTPLIHALTNAGNPEQGGHAVAISVVLMAVLCWSALTVMLEERG